MSERADIFAEDFDVEGFEPRKRRAGPSAEEIRQVAENSAFKSREPEKGAEPEEGRRRARRVYRTGRDAQFTCKARPDVVDAFYAISNAQSWVMGETLERAVAALQRELGGG